MTTHVLEADCVGKRYGNRQVLSSASLRATSGEVRVLFGRNGIGKSTLIKIAAGFVRADTGSVRMFGVHIERPVLSSMAHRGVFFLPDHDLLAAAFTLGQQLEFFARRFDGRSVLESATLADVEHLLTRQPRTLSGGELRRAELAAVLVRRPVCLIADEPYRGMAPVDHDKLASIFRFIAGEGCAVVITGHEVPPLLELADHVTWCTSGTTYELGTANEARANSAFRREYLLGSSA